MNPPCGICSIPHEDRGTCSTCGRPACFVADENGPAACLDCAMAQEDKQ